MARSQPDLRARTDTFLKGLDRPVARIVTALANAYCIEVQHLMETSPHSGRWYRHITLGGTKLRGRGLMPSSGDYTYHQASAPGEPPAVDKGLLVNSVGYTLGVGPRGFEAVAGSSIAKIPLALEFGRRDGTLAPRPSFRPALETIRQRAPGIIAGVQSGAGA